MSGVAAGWAVPRAAAVIAALVGCGGSAGRRPGLTGSGPISFLPAIAER